VTFGEHNELLDIVKNRRPGILRHETWKGKSPFIVDEKTHPPVFETAFVDGVPALVPYKAPCPPEPGIHEYFGLSYASYLVLPRSVMQSMLADWQTRFVGMLGELHDVWEGPPEGTMYDVALIDDTIGGGRLHDNLSNYDRGRRQIPLKSDGDNEYVKARDEYDRAAVAFDKAENRLLAAGRKVQALVEKLSAPLRHLLNERNA
jgi:hypothetical protein